MRCRLARNDWVIARRVGAIAADGEGGIDGKPFLRRDARLVESSEPRQGDREVEMRGLEIPVDLDCMAQSRTASSSLARKTLATPAIGLPTIDAKCREG